MGNDKRKVELSHCMWIEYFQLADIQSHLKRMNDSFVVRFICVLGRGKKVKASFLNLQKCVISKFYLVTCQYTCWDT